MLEDIHYIYMDIAVSISKLSYCKRKKVGCIVVKGNDIISTGWNATADTTDNCCEDKVTGLTLPSVVHAEASALLKVDSTNSTVYVTHAPCIFCANKIGIAKVNKVFYIHKCSTDEGLNLLKQLGIETICMKLL